MPAELSIWARKGMRAGPGSASGAPKSESNSPRLALRAGMREAAVMLGLLLALAAAGEPVRVARLELPVPGHSPFLLHGTVPLPRGADLGQRGRETLWVESHDEARTLVPAQLEIVSRASDGQPDVIEVLARVELGKQEREGGRSSYWLVQTRPAQPGPLPAPAQGGARLPRGSHQPAPR